ncbi:Putative histidine phosphatase superfamily, clade-1 [Septoria linicola]|uniref:Histidine phosphatase superfamily, clade-1 n=1 Tax=Septoria linicola TaxID=215465 RepID=A0A9Q9ATA2_9PEZI|nr:putative histidine phosphatase superfamily, clade-1 [Septoria linicola]USW50351.1 Putative histidine phosphatase superfamily, clade-1 [Septoria linicola]
MLEVIYVVRHGYRSNWTVDPSTGHYNSTVPSPTGIVADPALASYGYQQAEQLGAHLSKVQPPVDLIYSSPFYRCIQTLKPFTDAQAASGKKPSQVHIDRGVGEFYGQARFDHPSPATIDVLNDHFPNLIEAPVSIIPSKNGESIPQLHNRLAYALTSIIARADSDPSGPKTLLICTHAASMIAIGRALTGRMPEDEGEEDFNCFTCSFSKFVRKPMSKFTMRATGAAEGWDPEKADEVPDVGWKNGKGVGGGWDCEVNGDCSFLTGGEERGWHFTGDESFLNDDTANDQAGVGVEVAATAGSAIDYGSESLRRNDTGRPKSGSRL